MKVQISKIFLEDVRTTMSVITSSTTDGGSEREMGILMTGRKNREFLRRGSAGRRLSVRQRGSEPRIPRMAPQLTWRTALSVELACTKSSETAASHNERKARATMEGLESGTKEKHIARHIAWYQGVAWRFWKREPRKICRDRDPIRILIEKIAGGDLSNQIL